MRFHPGDHVHYIREPDAHATLYTGVLLGQAEEHAPCPLLAVWDHPDGTQDCTVWRQVLNTEGDIHNDVPECLMRLSSIGRDVRGEPFAVSASEDC